MNSEYEINNKTPIDLTESHPKEINGAQFLLCTYSSQEEQQVSQPEVERHRVRKRGPGCSVQMPEQQLHCWLAWKEKLAYAFCDKTSRKLLFFPCKYATFLQSQGNWAVGLFKLFSVSPGNCSGGNKSLGLKRVLHPWPSSSGLICAKLTQLRERQGTNFS